MPVFEGAPRVLQVADLGHLVACEECGRPTYDPEHLQKAARLPEGFTQDNRRKMIHEGKHVKILCEPCRFIRYASCRTARPAVGREGRE